MTSWQDSVPSPLSVQPFGAHAPTEIVGGLVIGFAGRSGFSVGQGCPPQQSKLSGLHIGAVQNVSALDRLEAAQKQFQVEKKNVKLTARVQSDVDRSRDGGGSEGKKQQEAMHPRHLRECREALAIRVINTKIGWSSSTCNEG